MWRKTYTKCLIVVPIPPLCTPLTYAAAMIPDKNGSSEKLSKLFDRMNVRNVIQIIENKIIVLVLREGSVKDE